jgi:hypothetical protein
MTEGNGDRARPLTAAIGLADPAVPDSAFPIGEAGHNQWTGGFHCMDDLSNFC